METEHVFPSGGTRFHTLESGRQLLGIKRASELKAHFAQQLKKRRTDPSTNAHGAMERVNAVQTQVTQQVVVDSSPERVSELD